MVRKELWLEKDYTPVWGPVAVPSVLLGGQEEIEKDGVAEETVGISARGGRILRSGWRGFVVSSIPWRNF